jgi:2,4-dienoyl-CoA reductase-like NADH-dependent reductase (Old Yellow Enzyme family)
MINETSALFVPFKIGRLALRNRIVMAPMTRSFSPGGIPGADVAAYYRRRAENQVGLIISEGTLVPHPAAGNDPNVPAYHGRAALKGWAHVVAEVHAGGGRIMPQLWHVGSMRRQGDQPNVEAPPVAPSGLLKPGKIVTQPLSAHEIESLISAYAYSAARARELGFDGVEIHGAHGYLIDQFFWSGTNERTDQFGGGIAERARFAAEIVRACRAATSPDFPIILRFSQWKQQDFGAKLAHTPAELAVFLQPLSDAGVDMFHCSTRRFWEPEFASEPGELGRLNLAGWTKKITGRPSITVGSIGLDTDFIESYRGTGAAVAAEHLQRLVQMISLGEVDLAAVGRALIADPAWAVKLREGRLGDMVPFTREALTTLH